MVLPVFIAKFLSFPLVGNLSSEGFWTSQNDIFETNTLPCIEHIFVIRNIKEERDV